jgi:aminoglycoside phosphotransferase (APT) family kinase protein
MTWPDAEVVIDESLVASLIAEQFPDLAGDPLRAVGEGFDNALWKVGDELVARLPRRASSVENLVNELRWLPIVAGEASLSTPLPLRQGVPGARFPWPWLLARWQDGTPGDEVPIDVRSNAAVALAAFLHSIHHEPHDDAPFSPYRSVTLIERDDDVRTRITELEAIIDPSIAIAVWDRVVATTTTDFPRSWIHGDLHPGNTIFTNGVLSGVVDFGDMCTGDVATDLAGGLLSFHIGGVRTFLDAYGVDDATLARTIGWALHFGLLFVSLGREHVPYASIGQLAIENIRQLTLAQ